MKRKNGFAAINWAEKFIEVLVVVVGITLAFIVNRSYENFKNRQISKMYVSSLQQDLKSDLTQLDSVLTILKKKHQNLHRLIKNWPKAKLNKDSLVETLRLISNLKFFIMHVSTFRSMEGSGQLNAISNLTVRKKLFEYYRLEEGLKILHQVIENFFNRFILPVSLEKIDMKTLQILDHKFFRSASYQNRILAFWSLEEQLIDFYQSMFKQAQELEQILSTMDRSENEG